MATYKKVSNSIPSSQRVATITEVSVGDRIDFLEILNRPAKKVVFNLVTSDDIVEYKVNNLRRLRTERTDPLSDLDASVGVFNTTLVPWWSDAGSTFTATGGTQLETTDGLMIESLEIKSLSLPSGTTTISINCT